MSTVRARENTFKVDLSNFPKRPSFEEIHSFLHETIGLTVNQVLRLQMNHAQQCAHVKCCDLKTAQEAVDLHNGRHEMEINKTKFKVRLVMDDGGTEVKIHDLSENIRNEDIAAFLKQYGEVISIKELVWGDNFAFKGVSSGVRVAKMILRRHIKSFVTILGEESLISYRNQPQFCRHCTNPSHPGMTCVENRKLLGQKADLNNRLKAAQKQTSYASVVNQSQIVDPLMPEFAATNLNELNANARSSRSNAAVDERGAVNVSSLPTAADSDKRMDGIEDQINPMGAGAAAAADGAAADVVVAATAAASRPTDADPVASEVSTADRSTQQDPKIAQDKITQPCQVSLFKIPPIISPPNPLSMEISESESYESSTEGGPFLRVKRAKGSKGSKKHKIDASVV